MALPFIALLSTSFCTLFNFKKFVKIQQDDVLTSTSPNVSSSPGKGQEVTFPKTENSGGPSLPLWLWGAGWGSEEEDPRWNAGSEQPSDPEKPT